MLGNCISDGLAHLGRDRLGQTGKGVEKTMQVDAFRLSPFEDLIPVKLLFHGDLLLEVMEDTIVNHIEIKCTKRICLSQEMVQVVSLNFGRSG